MASLSPLGQERLFFLGLGITTCAVLAFVRRRLIHYRDAAAIVPIEYTSQFIDQETEDSLPPSTLHKLLDNPNYGIQESAAIIICERALHSEAAINILLEEIAQADYDRRSMAIRALTMLMNSAIITLINKPETYQALVKSLEYSAKDYEHNAYEPDWDNWNLRDATEQGCLVIIGELIRKFDVEEIIRAGLIERWLVKEPWGGKSVKEHQSNFMDSLSKENHLNVVVLPLFKDERGRRRLEEAQLLPARPDSVTRYLVLEGTEDQTMADFDAMCTESRRPRGHSTAAEEHLRRRHREAMVLNDGTRPLGRDDIIERYR